MKRAIVWGDNFQKAELKYKEWCHSNNIPCRLSEAVLLSCRQPFSWNAEKIRGYYNEVMEDRIKLVDMSKEFFTRIYHGHYFYK